MLYVFAALPILVVLGLMLLGHWSGQRAGIAGWLVGWTVAAFAFGLTWDVLWVSQLKGIFLSLFVLAVLVPALFLYNIVDQAGGIRAMAQTLEHAIADRGMLALVLAWAFSGMLGGLAGFGLPIAIVAPMLVTLEIAPVTAVAAVAVGHAWPVTFGDMGVIFQTLVAIVKMDAALLAPFVGLMLGVACLLCGLAVAHILGQGHRWRIVLGLAGLMGGTQYTFAVLGITPLAAFAAGFVGMLGGVALGNSSNRPWRSFRFQLTPALLAAFIGYGSLTVLMTLITVIAPLNLALNQVAWSMNFPQVVTTTGFVTPAGAGQVFRFLTHPGTWILGIACVSYVIYRRLNFTAPSSWRAAIRATWRSAAPAAVGIISMVGLAALMDHSGMTLMLAQAASHTLGALFPIVSPLVGMLGAFATGSNNNSNVLFGSLQKNAALLLMIDPRVLVAAQTTGGALGSMLAPAKLIVGCSTLGLKGREGQVLRHVLPYGLAIGLATGLVALGLARL